MPVFYSVLLRLSKDRERAATVLDGLDLVREMNHGGAGKRIPTLVLTANLDSVGERVGVEQNHLLRPKS